MQVESGGTWRIGSISAPSVLGPSTPSLASPDSSSNTRSVRKAVDGIVAAAYWPMQLDGLGGTVLEDEGADGAEHGCLVL